MGTKEKQKNRPQEEQEMDVVLVPRQPLGRASASPCLDVHLPPFLPIDFFISVVFKLCESNQILVKNPCSRGAGEKNGLNPCHLIA